jgi:hypothetical protein
LAQFLQVLADPLQYFFLLERSDISDELGLVIRRDDKEVRTYI